MRRASLVVIALLTTLGCGHKSALDRPGWHQGVVEHDDRDLCFEIAGTVGAVLVARGAALEKDQELARLDETLEKAAVAQREADARTAQARLALLRAGTRAQDLAIARAQAQAAATDAEVAAADFERQRAVAAKDALAASQLDQARQRAADADAQRHAAEEHLSAAVEGARPEELAEAQAALDSAQAALAFERERLAKHHIHAPIPGRVVEIALDPGEAALPGRTVLTVADTKHPYVDAYVPQQALAGLELGGKAEVRADGDDRAYAAVIEDIGRQLEYTPRFLFSPADRPNLVMRVRVRIDDPEERLHAGVPAAVHFGTAP
jgi:HlyD family secretion protein